MLERGVADGEPVAHPEHTREVRLDRMVFWTLMVLALALVAVHGLVHNMPWAPDLAAHDSPVRLYFDLASEANLWSWFNVVVLAIAAGTHLVAGLIARARRDSSSRLWFVSAFLLAGLSIDDLTSLHERLQSLGVRLGGGTGLTFAAWLIPGLFFAVLVLVSLAVLAVRLSSRPRRFLLLGLILFLGGAFVLEAVGNALLESIGPGTGYAVLLLVEELAEAAGAICLLVAACAAFRVAFVDGTLRVTYLG